MTKDTSDERFPEIPKTLLDELLKRFPNKIPLDVGIPEAGLRVIQGQQQVIAFLQHHFDEQNKTVLESDNVYAQGTTSSPTSSTASPTTSSGDDGPCRWV